MAKIDRVDFVTEHPEVSGRPSEIDVVKKADDVAAAAFADEQLHLIPQPLQDPMVQQILERQAVFGF